MSKEKAFRTDLGSKAIVEHHALENDNYSAQLREVLVDMAKDLQIVGKAPKDMEYMGSFSVHVYASEILRTFAFGGVTNPHKCHHELAKAAMAKLREDVEEYYTGKRRYKRSGF